jgi:hypothetical protein
MITNITVQKLFQLDSEQFDKYHSILKHLDPLPYNNNVWSVTDLSFGQVATLKLLLKEPSYMNVVEIMNIVFGISSNELTKMSTIKFYHAINWIKNEIEQVYEREVENLTSDIDPLMKEAGVDRLNVFGDMNSLIMLGEKFSKSPDEIEHWNYNLVFSLLLHQKISSEVNKRYVELKTPVSND